MHRAHWTKMMGGHDLDILIIGALCRTLPKCWFRVVCCREPRPDAAATVQKASSLACPAACVFLLTVTSGVFNVGGHASIICGEGWCIHFLMRIC